MVTVGRRARACCLLLVACGCGGQSRLERGSDGDRGGRAGDAAGGSSGETGGSTATGGASFGGSSLGGSPAGGSAGSTGGTAGADPGIPPLECDEGSPISLSPEETAARLSLLFFGTEATDALVERAREDGLATAGAVGCFARAMLDDPESHRGLSNFFSGWLGLGVHAIPAQDPVYVPEFSRELLARAKEASVEHAAGSARSGGTFRSLLTESLVTADVELAPFYGLDNAAGAGFFTLTTGGERSGIFTQLYFLMSRASSAHGSPTQRGVGIAKMLGCVDFGAPPLDLVGSVPAEFEGTTRAWYEGSLAGDQCQGCHSLLTSAGYAFEHFDVLGRFRDSEAGEPIDASAELGVLESGPLTGHVEAMQAAAGSPVARRCFAEHWLAYAVSTRYGEGRYAVPDPGLDESSVEHVVARASYDPDFDLREMLVAGVESAPFLGP